MFADAAEKVVTAMVRRGMVEESRKIVCKWGMTYFFDTVFNIFLFAVIGILTGMPAETALFTVSYIILRVYAGGFHASTPERCCICSLMLLSAALFITDNAERAGIIFHIMTAAAVIILTILSPVSSENKPLTDGERRSYRRRALLILLAELTVSAAAVYLNTNRIYYVLSSVWIMLALMLVLGIITKAAAQEKPMPQLRKAGKEGE